MPDIEQLIKQHIAEKHAMGLHAVVARHPTGGVEIEGFSSIAAAQARADELIGRVELHFLTHFPLTA